ncbi:MAG: GDP-mannose 4,6-dehydratase [Deltaproteobacteria bacterium]|nr:GDP-mannose 4,6-dehydratase [Deltaproteobacteria bacterium]MBW2354530.1 GDP-mannose 4,6-dehydratase [Deltaproteobacteria bacterium]
MNDDTGDRTWLITGGCGFIGTPLIGKILDDQPMTLVRVLDNLSVGTREDLKRVVEESGSERVELIEGDVRDAVVCLRAAEKADIVVHLAANTGVGPSVEDPIADMEANVRGTLKKTSIRLWVSLHGVN